jgi:hypothetical protein
MIEFRAEKKPKIALLLGGEAEITFTAPKSVLRAFEELTDKPLAVTVKEYRQKRSLSQNSYLWVLLDKLGAKLNRSKEDIYKIYVKDCGIFEILPIRNDAVERFTTNWSKNGLGWFCEDLGESKLNGYTKLIAYYGSSTYNSKEMKRLIDAVIHDCEEQGIQTMPLSEIMLLQNDND